MPEDIDRPPAGTECVSCRAGGHFCPATLFVRDTDLGICQPCKDGTDCPRFKVVRAEAVLFEPEEGASMSAPARVIPPEEWPADKAIHEQKVDIASVPFGMRHVVMEDQGLSKPGSGRKTGAFYKTEKRELAKSLLLEGKSVRKAAAAAGISTNTVRLAKAEIPVEQLPPTQTGGFHAQEKQREYLERENSRPVPQPEDVLQLAADLVEARKTLADLEERWKAFFTGQR